MIDDQIKNGTVQAPDERLLLSYIRGKASEKETRQIEYWLKLDKANEKLILQIATIHFAQNRQQRIGERDPIGAYKRNRRRIKIRQIRSNIHHWSVATTVGLLIILIMMIGYKPYMASKLTDATVQQQMVTVQVNPGMRSQVELPDGTVVYLNSGSKLLYPIPFDARQRNVTLTGEAYFKVAQYKDWPLVASTVGEQFQVKAIGTEFNMQAFESDSSITTTLISGQVDVFVNGADNKRYQRSLSPSEKSSYSRHSGRMRVETVNIQYETAWIDGKIMFKNCRLPDVLKQLSYSYNVEFEVKNTVYNDYRLTGVFDNKQLSQILDYLHLSSNIKYQIRQATEDDRRGVNRSVVILY